MSWLQIHINGSILQLKVSPGARQTQLVGLHGGEWLKIRVHAEPIKGKANEALLDWLAKRLDLRRDQIELIKGQSQSFKKILLRDITPPAIRHRLQRDLQIGEADVAL